MDTSTSALADRVRDLVRQRRIDPRTDADAVRVAALDAIAEHDTRSLTGAVQTLDEPELVIGQIVADVSGFGPLQTYLDDPTVEEIWINEPSRVFVARSGRHELTSLILTAEQVRELVERMLSSSGRRLDISQPFVDAMLPGGHRLHVVLDGISRGFSAVNVRKFVAKAHSLGDLVTLGTLDAAGAAFLDASVRAGLNIVVSGGTQEGDKQRLCSNVTAMSVLRAVPLTTEPSQGAVFPLCRVRNMSRVAAGSSRARCGGRIARCAPETLDCSEITAWAGDARPGHSAEKVR